MSGEEVAQLCGWPDTSRIQLAIDKFGMPKPVKVVTTQERDIWRNLTTKKTMLFYCEKLMEWPDELGLIGGFSR
jgi:hypothetical protein